MKIFLALLSAFILMQLIRVDYSNPPVDPKVDFQSAARPPEEVLSTLKSACYDCHSNETRYPWYSQVAPLSWWIKNHIREGREHLNFSTLGSLESEDLRHQLEEAAEVIREKEMPMSSYSRIHADARLSDTQRALLAQWLEHYVPASSGWGLGQ